MTSGKKWETDFRKRWLRLGKKGVIYRLVDSSDLYGMNSKLVNAPPSPGDWIIGYDGWMALADTKATADPLGFKSSLIKRPQYIAATEAVAANLPYVFPIRAEKTGLEYFVPARIVLNAKGTVRWTDLHPFLWPEELLCPISLTLFST